jgi:tetratricopeptide (TPR) repeat protein
MVTKVARPLKIFYIYAHQDKAFLEEIEKHLRLLIRKGQIITWHNRNIVPGAEWEDDLDLQLKSADIILLLISPDFFFSANCEREMKKALARREAKQAHVVPILLRPIDYTIEQKISKLQMLPAEAKAISLWDKADEAFFDVEQGIRKLVESLLEQQNKDLINVKGKATEEDLVLCEEGLKQDPNNSSLYVSKGNILFNQAHFAEALSAYYRATELNPYYSPGHLGKARVYEQFIQHLHEQTQVYELLAQQSHAQARQTLTETLQGETKL